MVAHWQQSTLCHRNDCCFSRTQFDMRFFAGSICCVIIINTVDAITMTVAIIIDVVSDEFFLRWKLLGLLTDLRTWDQPGDARKSGLKKRRNFFFVWILIHNFHTFYTEWNNRKLSTVAKLFFSMWRFFRKGFFK